MEKEKWIVAILIEMDNELRKFIDSTEKDIKHLVTFNIEKWVQPTECLTWLINVMQIRKGQRDMIEKIFNALRDLKGKL